MGIQELADDHGASSAVRGVSFSRVRDWKGQNQRIPLLASFIMRFAARYKKNPTYARVSGIFWDLEGMITAFFDIRKYGHTDNFRSIVKCTIIKICCSFQLKIMLKIIEFVNVSVFIHFSQSIQSSTILRGTDGGEGRRR